MSRQFPGNDTFLSILLKKTVPEMSAPCVLHTKTSLQSEFVSSAESANGAVYGCMARFPDVWQPAVAC